MAEESFVEKFLKGYADATSSKARLKTATYVSPVKLAERRFYWEAVTEEGDVIEIDVPLPKNIITDLFSFLFLAAYNFLFVEDVIEKAPIETETENGEAVAAILREKTAEKLSLKRQGHTYLEYFFYILWTQDDPETREAIEKISQADDWGAIFKLIPRSKVRSCIVHHLSRYGLEHPDTMENLIPLALDLYLYVNSLRKPKIRMLDEEGVKERAEGVARWL